MHIEIAQPAAVMDESETVKWDIGKTSTEKAEIQQPDHPMVTTHCAPTRQSPPSQGVKPRISNLRRSAPSPYGAGVMIAAVIQAEDRNKTKKELLAVTDEFRKPRK